MNALSSKARLVLIAAASLLSAHTLLSAEVEPAYTAISTNDVEIAADELLWLVKPLTKEELVVESDAWRDLLKLKVVEISAAEIAVKRQNDHIERTEEAADATEEARNVAEEALEKAAEAQEAVEEVKKANEEAKSDQVIQTAQQVLKEVDALKELQDGESPREGVSKGIEMVDVDTNTVAPAGELDGAVRVANIKAEEEEEEKLTILNALTELRTQRSALIERFDVVLNELKAKGGEIEVYEKYRDSVAEVIVDVSDTSAVWTFVTGWLTSEKGGVLWGINISKFLGIMAAFYGLALLVGKAVEKATRATMTGSQLLKDFINVFARRTVIALGLLVAVSAIGVSATPLLALITAAGLVIGLALQGTLSNFASGLLLLFYRPFDVGDAVDAGGTTGKVDSMNLMSTVIRSWDNKVMIVPNNSIWANIITNITRTSNRRVDLVFGISYSDPIEKSQAILEKILKDHPDVLDDPEPLVRVFELGDSSVNFIVRPWVKPENYWEVYWSITRKVKEEFDKQGVSIPFPQRDVHVHQETSGAIAAMPDLRQTNERRDGA